ncbi:UDP-GlcNAc:undecaprenyl-phosphate GlcNAc-1-phosphate transferase [Actinokineospora baliensis]|uniref:glycosyltransferase family 4 protein n=1 Tax=Actinokineospora baliensis TaxID=547056 RepID=UPI001959BED5|nr:MraY family glycosyltransferase [Actinokineospora baliensis]MBM7776511.1 UDP-GlcNAc:undecaprenyl-phosphate GlcNAc-1-phosphate transferase [Actinokineospora baliensis]
MNPTGDFAPAGLPVREYLLVGLVTAVLTFLLTGLVRLFAIRFGAVAYPRQRDVHVVPMPRLGGLGMYLGVCGGMLLAHQLPVLRRAFDYSFDPTAVLIGGGIIVLIGMLDDRFELDSLTKLAGQITCAGILVLYGIQWVVLWVPWGGDADGFGSVLILDQNQGGLLAILLAVTLINAINFIDGLDGLAAGVGMIAAAATAVFALHLLDLSGGDVGTYSPALIAATLAGACLGFLPHNFQPARLFMGDSGSMLIGLMLAAASTTASGRANPPIWGLSDAIALFSPLLIVAAVLFIPVLDLLLAVIRRTRRGVSPFSADKMHLHHRLLEIGHSQRRAVLLIYLWACLLAFGAVAVTIYDVSAVVWVVGVGVLVAVIISAIPRLRSR